jgi:hypothetical protein
MTWSEIKQAIEQSGISEDDEIIEIHCQLEGGNKTLHRVRLGRAIRLDEDLSERAQKEGASGCTV